MGSSALELVLVPILWGTLGSICAATVLLYAMQGVEAIVKKCSSAPASIEPATRRIRRPLPGVYPGAARRDAIRAHG